MTIDDAEDIQDETDAMFSVLSDYTPKSQKYIGAMSCQIRGEKKILKALKIEYFR